MQPKQVAGVSSWQIQLDLCLFYEHCLQQRMPLFNPIILDEVSLWPKMLCGIGPFLVGSDPLTSTTAFNCLLLINEYYSKLETSVWYIIGPSPFIILYCLDCTCLCKHIHIFFVLEVAIIVLCTLCFFTVFPIRPPQGVPRWGPPSPLYPSFFCLDQDHVSKPVWVKGFLYRRGAFAISLW